MACSKRVLVAGFGSLLQGDDSFGVRLLESVEEDLRRLWGIDVIEVSTNGMLLVQQLMERYDVLIILDAIKMGGPPGKLYVLEVKSVEADDEYSASVAQLHEVDPQSAIQIASALGVLPRKVYLVGCEPATIDFTLELSPQVSGCLEKARDSLFKLINSICSREVTG